MQNKNQLIRIYCKNTQEYKEVPRGSSLLEVYEMLNIQLPYKVVAAYVNYKLEDLNFLIYKPKDIEFVDASHCSGMRCYVRTLTMAVCYAVNELYPELDFRIEHPISKGYFCTLIPKRKERNNTKPTERALVTEEMVQTIKNRVHELIRENKEIVMEELPMREVIEFFKNRYDGLSSLMETVGQPYLRLFRIGDFYDYYTGVLMPSTGYLSIFDLELYFDGMLLRIPNRTNPSVLEDTVNQEKTFGIFNEYIHWNNIMNINNVADFNNVCKQRSAFDIIKLSEALHEKKVAAIADQITTRRPKFVLISGPSSSGKTTFSKRLTIQLRINGITPIVLSMDNYFVNREDTPRDENGQWDFEDVHALDLALLQEQIAALSRGEEVALPTFNFEDGKRHYMGNTLKMEQDNIIILEGIHALNPIVLPNIPRQDTFKIYVSALTTISLDNHNYIPTTDTRLIRRVVRDYRYRGYSARETIARAASVQRGETRWIYPYQENADAMFNSALPFELAVLKKHAEVILQEVPKACPEYTEAHRLLRFLEYIVSIPESKIPPTSLLREFVGGSSFHY